MTALFSLEVLANDGVEQGNICALSKAGQEASNIVNPERTVQKAVYIENNAIAQNAQNCDDRELDLAELQRDGSNKEGENKSCHVGECDQVRDL